MQYSKLNLIDDRVVLDHGPIYAVAHLDHVDGVGIVHRSFPLLLLLALGGVAYGVMDGFDTMGLVGVVVGVICLFLFFATRKAQLQVHAGTLVLPVSVSMGGRKAAKEFADGVVTAVERRRRASGGDS